MIPINKPKIWLSLFLFLIIIFIISIIYENIDYDRKYGHYKEIGSDTIINSVIINLEKGDRGFLFITLKNNKGYWIARARNHNYNPSDLRDFIEVGDSLSKSAGTDIYYFYREGKEFEFNLKHDIEKK